MKPNIILMNFTHVYEQERFINDIHFQWIDCNLFRVHAALADSWRKYLIFE